ncbi:TlpA family protein disulfide reductase [Arcobacter sp. YIC-80]|uniref:TlpA family protein disulfide reductase n=1 Tax=Arcobacter sp. YIC-80 TaxID=3376683 RepID=UPI00384CC161
MKTIFSALLLILLIPKSLLAYKLGDKLDDDVIKKLGIKNDNITIVDFFASWCASCEKELPLINKLHKEEKEKITFIGVATDKDVNEGKAFIKRLGITFNVISDSEYEIVNKFQPIGMPALYYIKNGTVVKILYGAIDNVDEVIKNDVKGL